MLRMLLAAGVVYILLPQNLEPKALAGESEDVTTVQTFVAADAIIRDIAGICERNIEACETVKAIMRNTKLKVQSLIGSATQQESAPGEPDLSTAKATPSATLQE